MAADTTEAARRVLLGVLNEEPKEKSALEALYGQVWNTTELGQDFDVIGFLAPYVGVRRKSDGVRGSLLFQDWPRFYFRFLPE
jgi:hypothetical protein